MLRERLVALDFRDLSVLGDAIACALMSTQVPEGRQSGQLRALTGAGAFRKMRPLNIGLETRTASRIDSSSRY